MKVRWRLYNAEIPIIFAALSFFLLFGLGSLVLSWEFINYWRIERHHYSAAATVTQIKVENGKDKSVWASVRYTTWDGHAERLRREVAVNFSDAVKVGDQVTVDYLPNQPWIGHIRNWDLDGRKWVWLIMALPTVLLTFLQLKVLLGRWCGPLHEQLLWGAIAPSQECVLSPANLHMLAEIAPARHEGTLMLKPPKGSNKPLPGTVARRLKDAGLEAREVLQKFVVLGPDESRRLLSRMGAKETYEGGYMVLDCATAQEAERLLLEAANGDATAEARLLQSTQIHCLDQTLGPLSEAEAHALFQEWILLRLRRLYGGALPQEITAPEFRELFDFDASSEGCILLIERAKRGPHVWLRKMDEPFASRATFASGNWTMRKNLRAPRRMTRTPKTRAYKTMQAQIRSARSPVST